MHSSSEMFDVIICGAGPAGCTAALALGTSGLKTGLIEKESFPGNKVCGDAIPAYVPKILGTINQEYSNAFARLEPKEIVNTCRIVAPNGKILDLKYPESGVICKRQVFDNFLFELTRQLSNLTVYQATAVKDITIENNLAVISTSKNQLLKARLVIGCDGAHSLTKRKLSDSEVNQKHSTGVVRTYFKNVKDIPAATFELHFLKGIIPGYFWIFPLPDNQSNVGIGLPSAIIKSKRINLKKELLNIIETNPFLKNRFSEAEMVSDIKGSIIPLWIQKAGISGRSFMLCGDAALLADPLTGAGIGQAMISGRYAGWHAIKCFEQGSFSSEFLSGYDNAVYKKLWKETSSHHFIRKLISLHPAILNSSVSLASKSRFIYNMVIKTLL